MQIAMVGLGRMGSNMARRLMRSGHECVGYDHNPQVARSMSAEGLKPAATIEELVEQLKPPRVVWVMVPSGEPTEQTIAELGRLLQSDDVVIDGGNSYFKDDVRRSKMLHAKGIHFVDAGTSGGVWGLDRGYCLMIGGQPEVVKRLDPLFKSLAPGTGNIERTAGRKQQNSTAEEGYLHCGPVGSGHFVKMVHNGIEYGIMQAYAEGFDIMYNAGSEKLPPDFRYNLDMEDIAEVWRRGSVVGSWLLDLTAMALAEDPKLARYTGYVQDSGEGRWTVQAAIEEAVPAAVLSAALFSRFRSREESPFADKMLSAMRNKFGGHIELPAGG